MTCWKQPTSKDAFTLSWISVLVTAVAVVVGIVMYEITGSSLCLVMGLENIVDLLSSVVVLWRFYVPKDLTEEVEKQLKHREERASVGISIIMIFLGFAMLSAAIERFTRGQENPVDLKAIIFISVFSAIVFGVLTAYKFSYSYHLDSPSLYKDGLCSLIGTTTSLALFFNSLIIVEHLHLWWIDPLVSALCGAASLGYGGWSVFVEMFIHGANLCSIHYWAGEMEYDTNADGNTPDITVGDVAAISTSPSRDLELTEKIENETAVMT